MKRPQKTYPPRPARLFAEPEKSSGHIQGAHTANIDGAARGNPGPAAYGVVVRGPDGTPVASLSKYVGRATNNVAEYYALIAALDYAAAHGIGKLRVRSDSELLVRQMQGHYKVKSAGLRPLHERARKLAAGLAHFGIEYVPREENAEADALANAAFDRTGGGRAPRIEDHETRKPNASTSLSTRLETRTIRARYSRGALHPVEPLDLPDGAEVELTIHKAHAG